MAQKTWIGGDSGNENSWNTAANWSGGVPVAGDDVIVTGTISISGFNASAVALSSFRVVDYTGTIGSQSSYLQLDADYMDFNSTGKAWLSFSGNATSFSVNGTASVVPGDTALEIVGSIGTGTLNIYGNTDVRFRADAALVYVWDEQSRLYVTQSNTPATDTVTISAIVSKGQTVIDGAGISLTSLYVPGGVASCRTSNTMTLVQVENGATLDVFDTAITTANCYDATLNLNDTIDGKTVTNLNVTGSGVVYRGIGYTITNAPTTRYTISAA